MSEYQYVGFRAIDGPLSDQNLAYMERQSSRAEITPWSFDNEYQYGDFRGNAAEMLRRGYDLHLHYANFGTRTLMIRLPHGLQDMKSARPYLDGGLRFLKDKRGKGGILVVDPFHEPDDLEELWEIADLIERLIPLRDELVTGDLRPLYLAHLAVALDGNHDPEETQDATVPAGLGALSPGQLALAELYGFDEHLLAAAAWNSPPLSAQSAAENQYTEWLIDLPEATKNVWLAQLIANPRSSVRGEILADFRKSRRASPWPTVQANRTIAQLLASAEEIERKRTLQKAQAAARIRTKKLAKMAADPKPTLRETEQLVKQRTNHAYDQIARLLADLREALAGTDQSGLAEEHACQLKQANPTLNKLTASLRRGGFLKK
jgi:hypothetical protein